jgi:hypothetical protein
MADSSTLDVNVITNAVDASGSTVISVVQSNVMESSTVDATITTGGVGETGPPGTTNHTLLTNIGVNTHAQIDTALTTAAAHIANTSNPHSVTKAQVGLGSANDTSDADKPVSTAQAAAIAAKLSLTGGQVTGLIDVIYAYAMNSAKNTSTAQYSGAGMRLLNTASTMGDQAGVMVYAGINDTAASEGYLSIDKVDTTGAFTGHLMLFDFNAALVTLYQELFMSQERITGVGEPISAQDAATKNYVDTTVAAIPLNRLTAPDGGVWEVSVSNSGNLITTLIPVDTEPIDPDYDTSDFQPAYAEPTPGDFGGTFTIGSAGF